MGSFMNRDMFILCSVWVITVILLVLLIKRKNAIRAQVSFLFMQVPSWLFGAIVVQNRLIEYPEGFLRMAYRASFTFEFFVFPAVSAIFNVHFPKGEPWFIKTIYILGFPTVITITEVILEKYTRLIKYIHWAWYWSFITMTITLLLSYAYYVWFFKNVEEKHADR